MLLVIAIGAAVNDLQEGMQEAREEEQLRSVVDTITGEPQISAEPATEVVNAEE